MVALPSAKAKQLPHVAMWLWWFALVLQAVETMMGTTTALHQLSSGHGQIETPHPVPILQEDEFARTILV